MWGKIPKTVIIFLALAIIIVVAIFLFIKNKSSSEKVTKLENPAGEAVLFPGLSSDGQTVYYYSRAQNKMRSWDLASNKVSDLFQLDFQNVDAISYSPDFKQALIHWANPQNAFDAHTWLASFKENRLIKELSTNIINAAWSPDSEKIAYHYFDWDNNINTISVARFDGTNYNDVAKIQDEAVNIIWLNNDELIYYQVPSEASAIDIFSVTVSTEAVSKIGSAKVIGQAKAVIGQNKLLLDLAEAVNSTYTLSLYDPKTDTVKELDASSDVARTVQVNDTAKVYAVSKRANKTYGLIKIDAGSGKSENANIELGADVDPGSLMFDSLSQTLYYTSGINLYKVRPKD